MNRYNYLVIGLVCIFSFSCTDEKNPSLNFSVIDPLLTECRDLLTNAVEGEELNNFVAGSKAIFEERVVEAEHIRNNTDRQSAIDNYVEKLETSKNVFLSSKVAPACPVFNGTAYIDCGMASAYYNETFTLEAWVYADDFAGGSIIGAEGSGDEGLFGIILRLAEGVDNAIDFTIVNGTWSSCLTPENSISLKSWVHIAATFDSQTAKVYLNGVESASMTIGTYIPEGDTRFIIGDLATWNGRFFRGRIYDVRVWNTVRTEEQIQNNYQGFLQGNEEGLVANWPLNVKSGNSITDITKTHPATLYNILWADLDNNR